MDIDKNIHIFRRLESIKKNQIKILKLSEIKNSNFNLLSRWETVEDKINEKEKKSIENIQTEAET